jgi:hypothetical protein
MKSKPLFREHPMTCVEIDAEVLRICRNNQDKRLPSIMKLIKIALPTVSSEELEDSLHRLIELVGEPTKG